MAWLARAQVVMAFTHTARAAFFRSVRLDRRTIGSTWPSSLISRLLQPPCRTDFWTLIILHLFGWSGAKNHIPGLFMLGLCRLVLVSTLRLAPLPGGRQLQALSTLPCK